MLQWANVQILQGELFTHINDVTGKQTTYYVDGLEGYARSNVKPCLVPVTAAWYHYCMKHRGVEEDRVTRLADRSIIEVKTWDRETLRVLDVEPILLLRMEDNTYLMANGTHRYVSSYRRDLSSIRARIIEDKAVWSQFIVEGVPHHDPEQLLRMRSGR